MTQESKESGFTIVSVLVTLAVSALLAQLVNAFFLDSRKNALILNGDSEILVANSVMLKQMFSGKCFDLALSGASFQKAIEVPTKILELKDEALRSASESGPVNKLAFIKNSLAKGYEVSAVSLMQRSNVIGNSPGRVLADLEILTKNSISQKTVPILIPLNLLTNAALQATGCATLYPDDKELCEERGGTYAWTPGGDCALP